MAIARLDRHVLQQQGDELARKRLSSVRDQPRFVLLGEPGIGKSTAFALEAVEAGTEVVSAYEFSGGKRPGGRIVFIDALEEYRIGEAGVDRLLSLIEALKSADYSGWRIACRAISLPPPDLRRLTSALGEYLVLQLDLLDSRERIELLSAVGEPEPALLIEKVAALGAEPLLGNPATLLLLRATFGRSGAVLNTRERLFAEATRQMSHEINLDLPERADRPPPARIEAAAEIASLVLLLTVRTDLWLYSGLPPHDATVTRDDLIDARIDTEALRAAVDTPMFKGDAAGFQPTHRVVAEYLAGRALAHAVAPTDARVAALPLDRALAFLLGDNDRPAPALTGVFAWFVAALARSRLPGRVIDLIRLDPEAVLFHGDAAALTTAQREVLIDVVGRDGAEIATALRGSSAVGGLAGADLAAPMRAILTDPAETPLRKRLVLTALRAGRRVSELAPDIRAIVTAPVGGHYFRLTALDAYLHLAGDDAATVRGVFDDIAPEPIDTSAELRVTLAAMLVRAGAISATEVRDLIVAFAATGDRVMGYARGLGEALSEQSLPALLDAPIQVPEGRGVSRVFEVRGMLSRVVAATISSTNGLTASRLLSWLSNIGIDDDDRIEPEVQAAIAGWVDGDAARERLLFDTIEAAVAARSSRLWRADLDFARLTGRSPSDSLRQAVIIEAEAAGAADLPHLAQLAFFLVQPFEKHEGLYWRLEAALVGKAGVKDWHTALTTSEVDEWREKRARDQQSDARRREAANATDRAWLTARIDRLRAGSLVNALGYASDVYFGYRRDLASGAEGPDRVTTWLGGDEVLIAAVREGWGKRLEALATTPRREGQITVSRTFPTADLMGIAWADWRLRDGLTLELPTNLAFHLLRHAYALNSNQKAIQQAAFASIYADPEGGKALLAFWAGALRLRSADLPQAHHLDAEQPVVKEAVSRLLIGRRKLTGEVLRDLLGLAAKALPPQDLLAAAVKALTRDQLPAARRLWALVAFLLDPIRHRGLLASDLAGADGDAAFGRVWNGSLRELVHAANDVAVARAEAMIMHLGTRHAPHSPAGTVDRVGEVIGSEIAMLAQLPTEESAAALERLVAVPALSAWSAMLEQRHGEQMAALRAARFKPPAPREVARALAAGPPATPADLRAIVRHTLDELVVEIRNGDTSPWRHFWNRPTGGTPTPKVENDCRDLLTDRLRDRLERYGIPLKRTGTEVRAASDRRADLLVLGEGSAALPIEVKRHWNKELWTAVEDQLHPYTRSAGSNGHGIYLVLWFGTGGKRALSPVPGGAAAPTNAENLKALLCDQLALEDRNRIDIVVVDVSEPPPTAAQAKSKARKVAAKGVAHRQLRTAARS